MDDLISRQSVIDLLKKSASRDIEEVVITDKHIKIIKDVPTAYDKEKVVAELEKEAYNRFDLKLSMAIDIVKRGGVE